MSAHDAPRGTSPQREALVDLDRLAANLRLLRGAADLPSTLASIEADAYGHGLLPVARTLAAAGVGALLVSDLGAANALREAGIALPIVVSAPVPGEEARPAATRGILTGSAAADDFASLGAAVYGIPSPGEAVPEGLRGAMTLTAPVVNVKRVREGHGVSYGLTYRTEAETSLALVPLGYADGIPRSASGKAQAWLGGGRHPVAGRIAMDQFVLDVGDAEVAVGDSVIVFGPGDVGEPTAQDWADYAGGHPLEIVSRIGNRVQRRYRGGVVPVSADRVLPAELTIETPEAMHAFGRSVASALRAGDVLLLTGELGAGKTTFTRGLGEGLGVRGAVTSPTFVLARTHPSLTGGPNLVHVDAYRLGSAAELDDLDIDFEGSIVVVEWGAGLIEELSDSYLSITIDRPRGADATASDEDPAEEPIEPRRVTILGVGPRWA